MLDNVENLQLYASMDYRLSAIPGGLAGTNATVREIARLVRYDLERPQLRLMATRVLRRDSIQSKSDLLTARSLFRSVARNIRFQKDPIGIESVQSPTATLAIGAGDCDDHSGLVAGLAMAVGIPARFRVVGHSDDELVHIWPELFARGKWWPADTTEPQRGFGWRPARFPIERVYNMNGETTTMAESATSQVTKSEVETAVKAGVTQKLSASWRAGQIDLQDLTSSLDRIDRGSLPTDKPLLVASARAAVVDFIDHVRSTQRRSLKPAGGLSGLGGVIDDVWGGVKDGIGSVLGSDPQVQDDGTIVRSGPLILISPTITIPEDVIKAQATPGVAQAFGAGLGGSILTLGLVGAALYLILRK